MTIERIYIPSGSCSISPDLENQAARITGLAAENIVRIGGADRYATSLALAEYFHLDSETVCLATGKNFADALAGSVYAAKQKAPVIQVDAGLSEPVLNYLNALKPAEGIIFGGEAAVSREIGQQIRQLLKR